MQMERKRLGPRRRALAASGSWRRAHVTARIPRPRVAWIPGPWCEVPTISPWLLRRRCRTVAAGAIATAEVVPPPPWAAEHAARAASSESCRAASTSGRRRTLRSSRRSTNSLSLTSVRPATMPCGAREVQGRPTLSESITTSTSQRSLQILTTSTLSSLRSPVMGRCSLACSACRNATCAERCAGGTVSPCDGGCVPEASVNSRLPTLA
mmetsp:Transcript_55052/g.103174  ORF Transcript_55052/g.103174 Transcript_55052/m.103174 type:complete len:210 (-) Transcript_55052:104-733(-)